MAKGFNENQERLQILSSFGKTLARRCRSACELCEVTGQSLRIYEVPPVPAEPELERVIFICDACREPLDKPKRLVPSERWRPLANVVWSEVPAVQVAAIRLLRRLASSQEWARESLEMIDLDPEISAWADRES